MRLRKRLNAGDTVLGTFYKTPHPIVLEILAMAGFDMVVIDAEHAPFGRAEIDTAILTGRALGLDIVVRLPDDKPTTILQVMDAGAAGLLIPHVNTAAQGGTQRLKTPTLFLLDEFAALGRLEAVERAMGLMAGYGLQLWPILQDMSQLKDLYGDRAGTFIANAGVQQVFGVNDFETAKWLSQMMGQETTGYQTDSYKPGDAPSFSNNLAGRDLLTPDEIMQLPPDRQLLRVQGQATAVAQKLRYYAAPEFKGLFVPQDP